MALTRLKQNGLKVEASEGVAETIIAADCALNIKESSIKVQIGEYKRELTRATLTKLRTIKGNIKASFSGSGIELVGSTKTTEGVANLFFHGAGMVRTAAQIISVGVPSGPGGAGAFTIGTIIGDNATQGSATKTGRVIKYISGSPSKVIYMPLVGAFVSGETLNAYATSAGAAVASSAPAAAGHCYTPTSESDSVTPESLTVVQRVAGQIFPVVGFRNKFSFDYKSGQPLLMSVEGEGLLKLGAGNIPTTGGYLTSVPALSTPPKIQKGFPFVFNLYSPVATSLQLSIDNAVTPRETIGTGIGDVTDQGYLPPRITDRNVTGSTDPEQPPVATAEWFALAANGTTFPVLIENGLHTDTNGCLIVYAPGMQITGDQEHSDRNGIIIRNLSITATGDVDDELFIFQIWST